MFAKQHLPFLFGTAVSFPKTRCTKGVEDVTERLKAANRTEWFRRMISNRVRREEIVVREGVDGEQ